MRASQSQKLRKAIDTNIVKFKPMIGLTPHDGWIRSVRFGLRMSQAELAIRMELNQRTIHSLEVSEVKGKIRLETLKRAADALGCDLVYAFVPRKPLQETMSQRARLLAERQIASVNHNMKLEDQLPKPSQERVKDLAQSILLKDLPLWIDPE